jgi:hypothetical protein
MTATFTPTNTAALQTLLLTLDGDNSRGYAPNYRVIYTEDSAPVALADTDLSISSATPIDSATLTLINPLDGTAETLAVTLGTSGLTASYNNGVLTLSGTASAAAYAQVLTSATYHNAAQKVNWISLTWVICLLLSQSGKIYVI